MNRRKIAQTLLNPAKVVKISIYSNSVNAAVPYRTPAFFISLLIIIHPFEYYCSVILKMIFYPVEGAAVCVYLDAYLSD